MAAVEVEVAVEVAVGEVDGDPEGATTTPHPQVINQQVKTLSIFVQLNSARAIETNKTTFDPDLLS